MQFMSPSVGRRNKFDDESQLILNSPTSSDGDGNSIINGNTEVGFVFPSVNLKKTPVHQVVQSLKFQSSSKTYAELGSCPALNSGTRPLLARGLTDGNTNDGSLHEEWLQTSKGKILVTRQGGDTRKPTLITYHDIGLNGNSNFITFFNSGAMASVKESFCIYHITAPGQETGAEDLPEGYTYPTMDELSEQVEYVLHYFGISHCVGFGVGLGANILVRLARRRPTMIDGLILINCNSQNAGWVEWVYNKINMKSLRKQLRQQQTDPDLDGGGVPLPETVVDYLIWYHLGRPDAEGRGLDAVSVASIYRQYFSSGGSEGPNGKNLALLLHSYVQRTDLNLAREIAPNGKELLGASRALKTPVLNMTGDHSPHVEATVAFNGRLQPNRCTWMKIQDAAMILEEQPSKVSEAVKLFLQGLGYTTVRSLHTSRIQRTAVSLAGTPVKKPQQPSSTTSNTSRPSIIEPQVSGEKVQQEPTAQTSDLLIGGLAELMLKEPLTTKPITK